MEYQFIMTYNIYENGRKVGFGINDMMSEHFYLATEEMEEMVRIAIEKSKKIDSYRYLGDINFTRYSK